MFCRDDFKREILNEIARCETWNGFIFGSLVADGESFADYLADFAWYLDIHAVRDAGGLEVVGEPQRWRMRANWKTGAENFAGDSYHAGFTHSLFDAAKAWFDQADSEGKFADKGTRGNNDVRQSVSEGLFAGLFFADRPSARPGSVRRLS